MKLAKLLTYDSGEAHLVFWCPGCNCRHPVRVRSAAGGVGATCWGWNDSLELPTITPSIKTEWKWGQKQAPHVCHCYVESGEIRYLDDCTHEFAGQTMTLPLIDDNPHDPPESC